MVIAVCGSGSTKDLLHAVQLAKEHGASIIVLSNTSRGPLAILADQLLVAAKPVGKPADWTYPELKFDEEEAVGNMIAASRAYPKDAVFQEKAQRLTLAYPENINLLTVTAPLVP